jgi:P-loop Domain of unknown function (DUF2791)
MSVFVRLCGFSGLLVCFDEMVNLYKLSNSQARSSNYEQILRILNDVLQGNTKGLGFVLGGTPEFLMDTRRGLYSYAALQSRLAENTFAKNGLVDYQHPVIRLSNLTQEDFVVLLHNILHVFAYGDVRGTPSVRQGIGGNKNKYGGWGPRGGSAAPSPSGTGDCKMAVRNQALATACWVWR